MELKNKKRNNHLSYLYHPVWESKKLYLWSLKRLTRRSIEFKHKFPDAAIGFIQIGDYCIIAGGWSCDTEYIKTVRKLHYSGWESPLAGLPYPLGYFTLSLWRAKNALVLAGGYTSVKFHKIALKYDILQNKWTQLRCFEQNIGTNASCIVNPSELYSFGGMYDN